MRRTRNPYFTGRAAPQPGLNHPVRPLAGLAASDTQSRLQRAADFCMLPKNDEERPRRAYETKSKRNLDRRGGDAVAIAAGIARAGTGLADAAGQDRHAAGGR